MTRGRTWFAALGLAVVVAATGTVALLAPEALAAADATAGADAAAEADAHGGHAAESHGPDWWTFSKHLLNLVILIAVLAYLLRTPAREFMTKRSRDIREQIEASTRALEAAEAEIAELRARLSGLAAEREQVIRAAGEAALGEKQRSVARANEAAERVRAEARRVADQEVERARLTLQAEAAELATQLAGEILRERLGDDDDRRLVNEFTQHVGGAS